MNFSVVEGRSTYAAEFRQKLTASVRTNHTPDLQHFFAQKSSVLRNNSPPNAQVAMTSITRALK